MYAEDCDQSEKPLKGETDGSVVDCMCESEECSQSLHVMNTISPAAHCFGALQFLQEIPAFERPAGNALQCRGLHAQDPCWMGLTRACSHILEKKGEFYEISSWVEIWHWIWVGLHMAWKSVYGLHFMWYGCFVWQYLCLVRLCAWRCMSRLTLDRLEAWRMRRRVVSTLSHPPASCRCSTMLRSSPSGGGTTTLIP